ncbi:hypothetical protein VKT23_010479 [Stygiomarasmius scandens]|uniref:Uncharacterized protein n=1 Tax=Marasmiellus scandens TaxID=2682957 RepID=A0ABR1JEB3_9AGAR
MESFKIGFLILMSMMVVVRSANDWSIPCFDDACEYDLPATSGASGTLHIWGERHSISDITPAAGWEVIGCTPDALSQDVRLVCTNPLGCDHLFRGTGAEGKFVRLPDNCGKSAFARVTRVWTPEDQSIPHSLAARVVRRDSDAPLVQALSLDATTFAADSASQGSVRFAIYAINAPGVDLSSVGQKVSQLRRRGYLNLIGETALEAITDAFNRSAQANIQHPFDTGPLPVFSEQIQCGPATLGLDVNVVAKGNMGATFAAFVSGNTHSAVPIDDFQVGLSDFSASLEGQLNFKGEVSAHKKFKPDSDLVTIPIDVTGLEFPPFMTIGPTFSVGTELDLDLDAAVDMTVGLGYQITNGKFKIQKDGPEVGQPDFQIIDTPLTLSASPSVDGKGSVSAHLIPKLNFDIGFLNDKFSAKVFLGLDTSGTLEFSVDASSETSATIESRNMGTGLLKHGSVVRTIAAAKKSRQISPNACVNITAGLSFDAGIDGSLLDLLGLDGSVPLVSHEFDLFGVS